MRQTGTSRAEQQGMDSSLHAQNRGEETEKRNGMERNAK